MITNSAKALGDQPNSKSGGKAAGHNTDGFDCSTTNLVIEDRSVGTIAPHSQEIDNILLLLYVVRL